MSSMSKQEVKCRCCSHRIQAGEIMRTDLYERAPGQNYVYVKFRCRRCKRLGQTFVPEARWDWTLLEPARNELSDKDRERLSDAEPISETELLDFSVRLKNLSDLTELHREAPVTDDEKPPVSETPRLNLKSERKDEKRKDEKRKDEPRDGRLNSNDLKGSSGEARPSEARPDDFSNNG